MDVAGLCSSLLHSPWLLPLLAFVIALDGPFPVLPSETLLMSATSIGFVERDVAAVAGLFVASVVGAAVGDLVVFVLGRSSHRILAGRIDSHCGLSSWVRRHMLLRPGIALVGARFVPGGRLVSTAAAGRYGLPMRRFVPWSIASSVVWAVYMLAIGAALGPLTGGSPILSLVAGAVIAVLTGGAYALGRWLLRRRRARTTSFAVLVDLPGRAHLGKAGTVTAG